MHAHSYSLTCASPCAISGATGHGSHSGQIALLQLLLVHSVVARVVGRHVTTVSRCISPSDIGAVEAQPDFVIPRHVIISVQIYLGPALVRLVVLYIEFEDDYLKT